MKALGAIVAFILLLIVMTPLSIFFGWVAGHIVKLFCGDFVANGLNMLWGGAKFTPDMLPTIGGALGFIGGFFKSASTSSKN